MNKKLSLLLLSASLGLSSFVMAKPSTNIASENTYHAKSCQLSEEKKMVCSEYSVQFPVYSGQSAVWVNKVIANNVRLAVADDNQKGGSDWQKFIQYHADLSVNVDSSDGYVSTQDVSVGVSLQGQDNQWLALEVTPYTYYRGAAHGMPSRYFNVLDLNNEKIVMLDDILLKGQQVKEDLQAAQYQAAKQYFMQNADMSEADVEQQLTSEMFGFHLSEDWRPVKGGLVFGYGAYEIAPYAMGLPEIFVPSDQLKKILKPEVLKQLANWPVTYTVQ